MGPKSCMCAVVTGEVPTQLHQTAHRVPFTPVIKGSAFILRLVSLLLDVAIAATTDSSQLQPAETYAWWWAYNLLTQHIDLRPLHPVT
jgi:hypothetical protein